jgi:exosome complex component RRP4
MRVSAFAFARLQAEVQSFFGDGGVALHTRSAKYGRLGRGQLVCVPPVLIKRLKQHFCSLPAHNVDLVLGCNGWVWVQVRRTGLHAAGRQRRDAYAALALRRRRARAPPRTPPAPRLARRTPQRLRRRRRRCGRRMRQMHGTKRQSQGP